MRNEKNLKNPLDKQSQVWYNVNVNEGSPRQVRVTVQVSKVVTMGSTPTPLKKI